MRGIATFGLSAFFACAPALAHSQGLPTFKGQTIADASLKHWVLQTLSIVMKRTKFTCSAIDEVSTQPLSLSDAQLHVPTWMHLPLKGQETATYERWTINGCSKCESFIVTFWEKDGGMTFMTTTEKASDS